MNEVHISFQEVVEALLDTNKEFPHRYLPHFSDIDPAALTALLAAWPHVHPTRKRTLLDHLESTARQDTLVSFDDLGRALLNDSGAEVRARHPSARRMRRPETGFKLHKDFAER